METRRSHRQGSNWVQEERMSAKMILKEVAGFFRMLTVVWNKDASDGLKKKSLTCVFEAQR